MTKFLNLKFFRIITQTFYHAFYLYLAPPKFKRLNELMSASFYKNKLVNALRKLNPTLELRMCSFWQYAMVQKMHLHANHLLNRFAIWSSDSPDKSNISTRNRFGNRLRFLELNCYKLDIFELHSKIIRSELSEWISRFTIMANGCLKKPFPSKTNVPI